QTIIEGMKWVGLDWDEGPFRQTERMDLYRSHAMQLLQKGQAYWCICKAEELDARSKEAEAKGLSPKYDGSCRDCGQPTLTGDAGADLPRAWVSSPSVRASDDDSGLGQSPPFEAAWGNLDYGL